jgi:hypothetical protein
MIAKKCERSNTGQFKFCAFSFVFLIECPAPEIRAIIPPHSAQKSPLPLFSKEGLAKLPPLKKGDSGGFECGFNPCHGLQFLNELLRHTLAFDFFDPP